MLTLAVVSLLIFTVAVTMTMVGKGGGNFYVVILAMANIPMHEAATTGQFILFSASVAAMVIFQKSKSISWALAILIGTLTALSALGGGYFSHLFSGFTLKLIFAVMLFIAGVLMLVPVPENRDILKVKHFGVVNVKCGDEIYKVNLGIVVPVTILTGFASGMVGVSGGSFLVPLMVLACGVPMHTAVGTASTLIASTAFMGFAGHAIRGDFNPRYAIPLALVTIVGGIVGSKFSLKSKPKSLKKLFAYTNWIAAIFMVFNALRTKGII
ncbi:MAG: sulfite exporter TauE/SafE family protein [Deltaproteobacteria bacterium]|nr:sulfite exporter TauE/SafE family protein [Deltaproteobacteria bacterium]MBW2068033.1 sulfite exporter TauE/SafE family protein [Deltaproteobacteria bacterium]